jgi:hypothetical protein
MEHTAVCSGHELLMCGSVAEADYEACIERLHALEGALQATQGGGNERLKIQRTPAFMHAIVLAALRDDGTAQQVVARGGFTDVGQHMGSEARNTCWPLVREVLKVRGAEGEGGRLIAHSWVGWHRA